MLEKILIIDDELDILEVVKRKLEAGKYRVIIAPNGKEGL